MENLKKYFRIYKRNLAIIVILSVFISGVIFTLAELGVGGQNGSTAAPNTLDYGLVGYWDFEEGEGQTFYDKSGNGNNGTLGSSSSVDYSDPIFGQGHNSSGENGMGLVFDGKYDYADLGNGSTLTSNSGFSYSFWMKWNGIDKGGYGGLIEYINRSSQNSRILIDDGSSHIVVQDPSGTKLTSAYTFSKDVYYHVVLTWDGSIPYLYVNGNLDNAGTAADFASSNSNRIKIGVGADWSPTYYFNGAMDEFRIYNRVLSEDEIRLLYNQKKPILEMNFDESSGTTPGDNSFSKNYAILGGGAAAAMPVWTTGHSGSALDFDGTDDYVEVKGVSSSWDLSQASYDYKNFSVTSQDSAPSGLFFSNDGSKMYMIGDTNNMVFQYSLSTAWDISSASYDSKYFSFSSQENYPRGIFIGDEGKKMYIVGATGDYVNQYSLSTAWDVSTATYDSKNVFVGGEDINPISLFFSIDGSRMYTLGNATENVFQYSLSTAWDVSTATYESTSFSVRGQNDSPRSIFFNKNGDRMYMLGPDNDSFFQYSISKPWDISTASYVSKSFTFSTQESSPVGMYISSLGNKIYSIGNGGDIIYQYGFYNNDSLDVGNEITISAWIKPTLGAVSTILSSGNTASVDYDLYMTQTGQVIFTFTNPAGTWQSFKTVSNILADGEYQHIAAVYDGNSYNIYLNGIAQSVAWDTGISGTALKNYDYGLFIGKRNYSTDQRFFNGDIDNIRVYNYARTADEISADYNDSMAAHLGGGDIDLNKGLVGYWDMEEGSGQFVHDKSGNGNDGRFGSSSSVDSADPTFGSGHDLSGEIGTGVKLDGLDDYIDMDSSSSLDLSVELTINLWVNSSFLTSGGLAGKTCNGGGAQDHHYKISNSGTALQFSIGDGDCAGSGNNDGLLANGFFSGYQNRWTFVTASYNRGEMKLYRNGELISSKISALTILKPYSDGFEIGRYPNYNVGYFNGSIDEVRVYNRALSEDEIRYLYNQKKPVLNLKMDEGSGIVAHDESFNNNDAINYGTFGTAEAGTVNTLTDNNRTWTTNEWTGETIEIVSGTGLGQTRTVLSNTATQVTVSSNWTTNPDTTSVYRITSRRLWASGRHQGALAFNGNYSFSEVSNPTSFDFISNDFTLEAWVYAGNQPANGGRIVNKMKTSTSSSYFIAVDTSGKIRYYISGTGTIDHTYTGKDVRNAWHHLAVSFVRSGKATLYIDGENVDSVSISGSGNLTSYAKMFVGGASTGSTLYGFNGSIDDARVYNYARTADEILTDYNDGQAAHLGKNNQDLNYGLVGYWDFEEGGGQTVFDKSGSGNNGTLGLSSSADSADPIFGPGHDSLGENGTGLIFNGEEEYVNVGNGSSLDITDKFTIFGWVKLNTNIDSSITTNKILIKFKNGAKIDFMTGAGRLYLHDAAGLSDTNVEFSSQGTWSAGQWINFAMTYDSSASSPQQKMYLDGVMSRAQNNSGAMTVSTGNFWLGYSVSSGSDAVDGTIDEIRIYNRALSEDEIRQLYNQKKPILHLKMDEGSGSVAYDESFNNNNGTLGGGTAAYMPTWVDGKFGSALSFDGGDDYVEVPYSSSMDITDEITLEGWFNADGAYNTYSLFGRYRAYYIAQVYRNQLRAYLYTSDYGFKYSTSIEGLHIAGSWYHVALSYKPEFGYIKLYLNGKEVEYEEAQVKTDGIRINTSPFTLGENFLATNHYSGSLDDVRLYNYARSDAEILADYNNGLAAHLR